MRAEPGRSTPLNADPFRTPDFGGVFIGMRAFVGEPSPDDILFELSEVEGSSSSNTWLPILLVLALRAYCISSQFPLLMLPCLLRGRGESRSTTVEGMGTGLALEMGIRDVLGRGICVAAGFLSAAISSGVRNSVSISGSNSCSPLAACCVPSYPSWLAMRPPLGSGSCSESSLIGLRDREADRLDLLLAPGSALIERLEGLTMIPAASIS